MSTDTSIKASTVVVLICLHFLVSSHYFKNRYLSIFYKVKSYVIKMFHKILEQLLKKHLFDSN